MKNADLFMQYMFGFSTGAGRKPIDKTREQHPDRDMRLAWITGFDAGRKALKEASEFAEKTYHYKPNILRAQ